MPRSRVKRLEATLFDAAFEGLGRAVRRRGFRRVVPRALGLAGRLVGRVRRFDVHAAEVEGVAREWQRMMPNPKVVPIVEVRDRTAYAEIRIVCPLRGTGDLEACHRMMAYDRAMLDRANTRFVILESQATPGIHTCRVALRPAALPAEDLPHAHLTPEGPDAE